MEIVKGKRTKRQRPYSPTDGGGDGRDGGYFSIPSPGFSGEISVSTEEEEDMANCLILLAQGFCPKQEDEEEGEQCKIEKFGKGLIEMGAVTTGKAGFYVYECKTCNRTFPSFQALGGHRASHKKPKISMDADRKEEQELGEGGGHFGNFTPPPSLHMAAKPASNSHVKSNKVHECSICGSEFSSGQALGGHMRRHRAAPTMKTATSGGGSGDVSTGESQEESHDQYLKNRPKPLREGVNILSFDLNLPAPTEDEHQLTDSKFEFRPSVKHLVFSAPALVDCHY